MPADFMAWGLNVSRHRRAGIGGDLANDSSETESEEAGPRIRYSGRVDIPEAPPEQMAAAGLEGATFD